MAVLLFPFQCLNFSVFSCIIMLAMTSSAVLNINCDSVCSSLLYSWSQKESITYFTILYAASCRISIYALYQIEEIPFYSQFADSSYYKWVSNIIKCFSASIEMRIFPLYFVKYDEVYDFGMFLSWHKVFLVISFYFFYILLDFIC